jgi:AcrR family transcriptional regulator
LKSRERDTRAAIVQTALDLFSARGYDGTSIRQIASEVGILEGSIYAHFSGKEEILRSIFADHGPGRVPRILESVPAEEAVKAPKESLWRLTQTLIERWLDPNEIKFGRLMFLHMLTRSSRSDIRAQDYMRQAGARLAELFSLLIEAKCIKKVHPEQAAFEYIAPLSLICIENITLAGDNIDSKRVLRRAQAHLEYFWSAIALEERD